MPENSEKHSFDILYFLLFSIMPKCRKGRGVLITRVDWWNLSKSLKEGDKFLVNLTPLPTIQLSTGEYVWNWNSTPLNRSFWFLFIWVSIKTQSSWKKFFESFKINSCIKKNVKSARSLFVIITILFNICHTF